MSFIPEEEINPKLGFNFAPMIDFLFLMVAFFACLAVSRVATKDTDIELGKIKEETTLKASNADYEYKMVNININDHGEYKWVTEIRDYPMNEAQDIAEELLKQYKRGLLPENKLKTQVLLKIDKQATWEPILKAIFAIRDAGFEVRPVYEPDQFSEIPLHLLEAQSKLE
jgi:biopolymer transport protein ExbD